MITFDSIGLLVAECRRRGVEFTACGAGFKCSAPPGVMTAELRSVLAECKEHVRAWLLSEAEAVFEDWHIQFDATSTIQRRLAWSNDVAAAADFVLLLTPNDLPAVPFVLGQGRMIVDKSKWLRSIQADIRRGANGPRSIAGSLEYDLRLLRNFVLSLPQ